VAEQNGFIAVERDIDDCETDFPGKLGVLGPPGAHDEYFTAGGAIVIADQEGERFLSAVTHEDVGRLNIRVDRGDSCPQLRNPALVPVAEGYLEDLIQHGQVCDVRDLDVAVTEVEIVATVAF